MEALILVGAPAEIPFSVPIAWRDRIEGDTVPGHDIELDATGATHLVPAFVDHVAVGYADRTRRLTYQQQLRKKARDEARLECNHPFDASCWCPLCEEDRFLEERL